MTRLLVSKNEASQDFSQFDDVVNQFLAALQVDPDLAIKILNTANNVIIKRELFRVRKIIKDRYGENAHIKGWVHNQELLDWLESQERKPDPLIFTGQGTNRRLAPDSRTQAIARVKDLRAKGLDQYAIAKELGLSQSTVSRYLSMSQK